MFDWCEFAPLPATAAGQSKQDGPPAVIPPKPLPRRRRRGFFNSLRNQQRENCKRTQSGGPIYPPCPRPDSHLSRNACFPSNPNPFQASRLHPALPACARRSAAGRARRTECDDQRDLSSLKHHHLPSAAPARVARFASSQSFCWMAET
jgi:hypothetical protein